MVTSPLLSIKSLFLFYSISVSIANQSLSSALKASKFSGYLLLRNSQDSVVSGCVPKLQAGTWKVQDTVLSCENDINFDQVCGNGNHNRHGLGHTITPKVHKNKSSKHYWIYISDHHKKNWWHLCLLKSSPTAGSGSMDKMDELCSPRLFLGFFVGNAS